MRILQVLLSILELGVFIVLGEIVEMPLFLHFNKALNVSPFRILVGLGVHDCWNECQGRLKCLSINYKGTICELNEKRQNFDLPLSERIGSVYQEKPFGPQPNVVKCGTNDCGIKEVCDYKTSVCSVQESEPFPLPQNGVLMGNDFSVGRKMRIGCKRGYVTSTGSLIMQTSECLPDGTWDITPFECIGFTDHYKRFSYRSRLYSKPQIGRNRCCENSGNEIITDADKGEWNQESGVKYLL